MRIANPITGQPSKGCAAFRAGTERAIATLHPVAVVVGTFSGYTGRIVGLNGRSESQAWEQGFTAMARDLHNRGIPLIVTLDDPALSFDPIECIAKHRSVSWCTPTRAKALKVTQPFNDAVLAGVHDAGWGSVYDPTRQICDAQHCQLEINGTLVFADNGHLTYPFALAQADRWRTLLSASLASAPATPPSGA